MNNNDIPEDWAVPDDMSEWLRKSVNKEQYAPEDDPQVVFDDMAHDIAILEPNTVNWGGWVS